MKASRQHINAPIANARRLLTTTALFLCASPATLLGDTIPYSHGDPTNLEQYQLELVNAARANPKAQATKLGIDLNKDLTPGRISEEAKQPLAFHPKLLQTARGHSDWMLVNQTVSNIGSDGSTPIDRAKANEYQFSVTENIWGVDTNGALNLNGVTLTTHEDLFKSPYHRPNLMDPSFSVVGLGLREGKFQEINALMVTQNFSSGGDSIDSGPFLVGVVYDDINKNGICDPGEGIPGVRVEPDFGGYHAVTSTSGGYAVPMPPIETLPDVEVYPIPLAVNSSTWEDIRPYHEAFRRLKIESATEITVQITWSSQNIGQAKQSSVTIRRPDRINYRLMGTDQYYHSGTMVTSLNVKTDLQVSLPRINSQPPATQILDVGFAATLSVSATGSDLTYQWYQGVSGDTSSPVGNNSSFFEISSLDIGNRYWVRVANTNGSVDSAESLVVARHPGTKLYSHGDPTDLEQYQLELLNAARINPKAQADKLGVDLNKDLTPGSISEDAKQPLAFHPLLLETARGHSDWMLDKDIFSHTGSDGSASTTQTMRAAKNGYKFSVAENIDWEGTSSSPDYNKFTVMAHENFFKSHTHRPNLMDPFFSVVGLGLRAGDFIDPEDKKYYVNTLMTTQNFSSGGDSDDSGPFLVGVVYDDLNNNGIYDPGEGIPGIRVEPNFGGYYAITSTSGGYAVPIPPLETVSEDYDIPIALKSGTLNDIRPYDEEFRRSKIKAASEIEIGISWSGKVSTESLKSVVKIRNPIKINYKLIGADFYDYESTMVSSLNVKADFNLSLPRIAPSQSANQILNIGSAATLSVSASGTALTYQWYHGARGDTSNPVGGNSPSFTTPSLTTNSSYWVRASNLGGSVDSNAYSVVVLPQGIRVGDQFFADLSPLVTGGKTLKLVGKLPSGLSLNTKTWQISGTVTGNAGNFTPSIQVIQKKVVLPAISMPISVGNFPTSLLGNYEALLKAQNGAPFGVLKLTTGKNVWTASLETLGQAKRTAKGSFVLQQGADSASFEVKLAAIKTSPALTLNFTLHGESAVFEGTYGVGTLNGFKMIDSLAVATQPILYSLIMDQRDVDVLDKPAGKGWASGSFTKTGIGLFKGMLGDATACSIPLRLSVTGQAILWAQPYANKNSYIGGVFDLIDLAPNANNYDTLEPGVSWVKVPDSKTLSYPNGFSFDDLSVSGSSWLVLATHTALGNSLGWLGGEKCMISIHGAGLPNESQQGAVKFPTEFTLDKAFKLNAPVNASTIKWSGSIAKGTGAFSGSFTLPANFSANTIAGSGAVSGLLVQDDTWGTTTGLGLIKVPISGAKGSFRTAALALKQIE